MLFGPHGPLYLCKPLDRYGFCGVFWWVEDWIHPSPSKPIAGGAVETSSGQVYFHLGQRLTDCNADPIEFLRVQIVLFARVELSPACC